MLSNEIDARLVAQLITECPRVVLVGPMGSGKTSIGKLLAQMLDFEFLDTDQEIVRRSGADIPWIFDIEGEAGFRKREQQVVADTCTESQLLIATGGGCILNESNRQALSAQACVVYLKVSVSVQLERTYRDKNRPLLQCEDPKSVLEKLQSERSPLYQSIAHIEVDTNRGNVRDICQNILVALLDFYQLRR